MTFGGRLEAIRKERGLTMAGMAGELGMTVPGYKRLEDGTGGKTFEKLPLLAKKLGCRIDDLFPEMDEPKESKTVCADGFDDETMEGWAE